MTKASASPSTLQAKEYAAIMLKVPQSGTGWLDEMIRAARDLDQGGLQERLQEKPEPKEGPQTAPVPKAPKPVSKKRQAEIVKELNPDGNWD